jgi:serine/threonine protein kinase
VTIRPFDLSRGRVIAGKYTIEEKLGGGWEGEVYRVVERRTGIHRAAKLFYPERNPKDRTVSRYARKLERLRACRGVIQYHNSETVQIHGAAVTCLISELVEGEMLSAFIDRQPGRRLQTFEAFHLLHSLAECLDCIHGAGEYHGDLHSDNVLVRRIGISSDLRILDFFYRGRATSEPKKDDIVDAVRLFYDAVGGRKRYAQQPREVKDVCRGLRRSLILKRFPSAGRLRYYLETFEWTVP